MTEQEEFCCETEEVHEDLLKIVNETMPDETELRSEEHTSELQSQR